MNGIHFVLTLPLLLTNLLFSVVLSWSYKLDVHPAGICTIHIKTLTPDATAIQTVEQFINSNKDSVIFTIQNFNSSKGIEPANSFHENCAIHTVIEGLPPYNYELIEEYINSTKYSERTKDFNAFIFIRSTDEFNYPVLFNAQPTRFFYHNPSDKFNNRFPQWFISQYLDFPFPIGPEVNFHSITSITLKKHWNIEKTVISFLVGISRYQKRGKWCLETPWKILPKIGTPEAVGTRCSTGLQIIAFLTLYNNLTAAYPGPNKTAWSRSGMYTMRMLDNGVGPSNSSLGAVAAIAHGQQPNLPHGAPTTCPTIGPGAIQNSEDRMEASSDSAVSSMGSERVPPMTDPTMSDNEWVDPESHPHSSHDSSPYSLDYSNGKIRGYDYYGKERVPAPVAQKKHHMFGKRFQQEQGSQQYILPHHPSAGLHLPYQSGNGLHSSSSMDTLDMKYGCSLEFARHQNDIRGAMGSDSIHSNHTYSLPPSHPDNPLLNVRPPRQPAKDKAKMNEDLDRFAEESVSRDEKRARSMQLPITTEDIINLPMDEFNERLSKFDLSEPQLSLIRDIRRRGKNKVAAQNCRKRKLDQILQLADEVQRIRERKQNLIREQQELASRRSALKDRYSLLYRHVFQALRDPDGNAYSPYDFSLQQAADGNIILVPRNASQPSTSNGSDSMNPSSSSRRDKTKDEFKKGEGHS